MRVLVVEDSDLNAHLFKSLIVAAFEVEEIECVADGEYALFLLKKNNYDLLILDIQLPNFSGIEIIKQFRKYNDTTPVIAVTAFNMKGDRDRILEAGFTEYIGKPIIVKEFIELFSRFLMKKI